MAVIAVAVRHMLAAGMDPDAVVAAVAEMEAQTAPARSPGAIRQERYRRRLDVGNDEWNDLRRQVIDRDGTVCRYCGQEAAPLHIDHIVPLARGGGSDIWNLTVACGRCNVSKKDKLLNEWRPSWV